ncbi:single-stranded DNA-binding protein [Janibacter sp. Soil728]|uniref:single-stranded DNA-binding protein n=1 Tax=Janibacter sp. Soil728 TaxID=1736393 RepID=UPI0006FF6CE7|nr:single-stranded DNA-binding protein [Janibacter sp. Soil728]KRE39106.1 single-stranded DNA-binding protein [Janibacter sp. Soil728]
MAGETPITVIGNLTADPELRFTPSGAAVANFTVASTPRTFDRQTNEWKDAETLFMRCSVWREAAENVAESLTRGTRVVVTGRLISRSWEDKETGQKRSVMEMQVDEVGPSMRYATAKVTKTQRGGGAQGGGGGSWGGGQQGGSGGGFGGQQDDPWATGGAKGGQPAQQGGGFSGAPAAPAQGGTPQGGGGWGSAPSYDEPPF